MTKWVDGAAVGSPRDGPPGPAARGSFMIHVRHAAAAIASGLCETVLITHGESGRSGVGRNVVAPTSLAGQFEQPYGPLGPPTLFTIPVLRYMIFSVAPAKARAQGRATRPRSSRFPLSRERRYKRTSNWRWSRPCSANGPRRTRASSLRTRSPSSSYPSASFDFVEQRRRWKRRSAASEPCNCHTRIVF